MPAKVEERNVLMEFAKQVADDARDAPHDFCNNQDATRLAQKCAKNY